MPQKIFLHFLRTHNMHQQVFLQKMKHETEFGKKFKTLHLLFYTVKIFIQRRVSREYYGTHYVSVNSY